MDAKVDIPLTESNSKMAKSNVIPVSLRWVNIGCAVPLTGAAAKKASRDPEAAAVEAGGHQTTSRRMRNLLTNVNGEVKQGQIMAIMGASGSGKSTLLDILACRSLPSNMHRSGTLLVNGIDVEQLQTRVYRRLLNYVTQEDVFAETLTVRETLVFAADLRLPRTWTQKQKMARVEDIIERLGLTKCANTYVGGAVIRGISGGERRRLQVATELLSSPSCLFLDEPTSGLSSADALMLTNILRDIAHVEGRTVVLSLHQPRADIFDCLDAVTLMHNGQVVYSGPANEAHGYFKEIGYDCPQYHNFADFMVDTVAQFGIENPSSLPKALKKKLDELRNGVSGNNNNAMAQLKLHPLSMAFQDFKQKASTEKAESDEESRQRFLEKLNSDPEIKRNYAAGFMRQVVVLFGRNFRHNVRHPALFWAQLAVHVILGVLLGSIFANTASNSPSTYQAPVVEFGVITSIFFIASVVAVMTFAMVPALIEERRLFNREQESNYYSTLAYFISKTLLETLAYALISGAFLAICYFWIGYSTPNFLYAVIVIILFTNVSLSAISAISAWAPTTDVAMSLVSLVNSLGLMFCGFAVVKTQLPVYWRWLYWVVHYQYAFSGLCINEFDANSPRVASLEYLSITGRDKWHNVFALVGFFFFFRILGYLVLRFTNRRRH